MLKGKIKKKIKRRPGQVGNMYFTDQTQSSIVLFQNEKCKSSQDEIYVKQIHPAFDSLVENLILVYGFGTPSDPRDELKSDCISFLYSSLSKWSPEKGTKAFSYFNVVAKNFLISNTRKSIKRTRKCVSVDQPELVSPENSREIETYSVMPSPDEILIEMNRRNEIREVLSEVERRVDQEHEIACIKAIITVFEKLEDLDFLNKRAIRIYVRDISGLPPKKLSSAMSSIKGHYRDIVSHELELDL